MSIKTFFKRTASVVLSAAIGLSCLVPSAFAAGGFNTNLIGLSALNGSWVETADGMQLSGGGDNFALSSTEAKSFVYSADVKFNENKGAASLIFLSKNTPKDGSYCANIDKNAKNARIFKFPGGSTLGEYKLTTAQQSKTDFNITVQSAGNQLNMFIDGVPVVSCADKGIETAGARMGLLTYDSSITYQNVLYSQANSAAVDSMTVEGAEFTPIFASDVYSYSAKNAYNADTIKFTPAANGAQLKAYLISDGKTSEIAAAGGSFTAKIPVGASKIVLTCTKDGKTTAYSFEIKRKDDPAAMYTEDYRPQFHFTPLRNFINDPNGLVYDPTSNKYQLYCQYNPTGMQIGNQVWLHASSDDMMNWEEDEDLAIVQDDGLGAIFSGSAVVDENNTSGLFTDNKPGESKLVAIFTHDAGDQTYGLEKQSIAYSKDHGHTWIKPTVEKDGFANPVLKNEGNKYGINFRDPKVFRYDDKWFMVIAGGRARLFTSDNLIDWKEAADFGFDSECPDLFCLPVDGDANNMKWVYTASGDWYIIGDLVKDNIVNGVQKYKFVPKTGQIAYNGAQEVYATQSYYNDGSGKNRRIALSWLQDIDTHDKLAGKTWNGAYSLPQENTIKTVNGQMRLFSYPVEEVNAYRNGVIYEAENLKLTKDSTNALSKVADDKFDIEATFTPNGAKEFGFRLRMGSGQYTTVKYSMDKKQLIADRSKSGKVMSGAPAIDVQPLANGQIKMRIIADTSILEAFGNDGEGAISMLYFPDKDSVGMELFSDGDVTVNSLKIYDMNASVREEIEREAFSVSASKTVVGVDEKTTVWAGIMPKTDSKATWSVDNDCVKLTENADGTVTVTGVKDGVSVITAEYNGVKKTVTVRVAKEEFITNLEGWKAVKGEWEVSYDGYTTTGVSGTDAFAFSDKQLKIFSYEAEYFPTEGFSCGGLVFGTANPNNPGSGTWYGANVTVEGNNAKIKLFENRTGSEAWKSEKSISKANSYKLKITVDENNKIIYTVNGVKVAEKKLSYEVSGYLGLVTFNSTGAFNNVNAEDTTFVPADFTELNKAIAEAEAIDVKPYTAETVKVLTDAITAAKAVAANEKATQDEVNKAVSDLNTAIKGLVKIEVKPEPKPDDNKKPDVSKPNTTVKPAKVKAPAKVKKFTAKKKGRKVTLTIKKSASKNKTYIEYRKGSKGKFKRLVITAKTRFTKKFKKGKYQFRAYSYIKVSGKVYKSKKYRTVKVTVK